MDVFRKTKICSKCRLEKSVQEFHKNRTTKDGLENWCVVCKKHDYTQRRQKRKNQNLCHCGRPREKEYKNCVVCLTRTRLWGKNNPALKKELQRKRREAIKTRVFAYYGKKCICCGEENFEFLAIDHINGGGNKHRKEIGSGTVFYSWLVREGFPVGYRTLCHNCNGSFGHYGYCPHQNTTSIATPTS